MTVRRLSGADAAIWRALRLEGLKAHPPAFRTRYEEAIDRPLTSFAEQLERMTFAGSFDGPDLVGCMGWHRMGGLAARHRGVLIGVYLQTAYRGSGRGQAMLEWIVADAAAHVLQLELSVEAGNHAARRLYERNGFRAYGREPRAHLHDGVFYDEIEMVRPLDA